MIDNIKNNVDELNEHIHSYVKSTFEYYKIDFFKKSMKTTVSLSRILLLGMVAVLFLFFFCFGLALLLGEFLGDLSYGFFIMSGVFLILLILVIVYGKKMVERKVLRGGSKVFFND